MDYNDAIACINGRQYEPVANSMLEEILGTQIHGLTMRVRSEKTKNIACRLRARHDEIYPLRKHASTPDHIAHEVYDDIYEEIVQQFGSDGASETVVL